jgi:tetratricopeptide (TPR) repeat protein
LTILSLAETCAARASSLPPPRLSQRVLQRASGLAVAHLNLGLVRHDQHDYAASTQEFSRAASLDPTLRQARLYLGIDAYLWGRYETASKALQDALKLEPNNAEALYWLGLAQAAKGDLRGAADSLETATKLNPKDHDGLYQLEEVYLQLWRATYERLVAANPESLRIHQVLAEGYVQSNRLEDAKREYALVLKANPTLTGVHEALGDIARQQQQIAAATKEYHAELRLDPSSARVWYKLADVLVDSGNEAEALKAAHSSIALQADFAPAYYVLGRLARQGNRPTEAIADFRKALERGLKGELEESSHYQLYRLLEAGDPTEAAAHQAAYLRLRQARQQRALNIAERELKVEEGGDSH